MNPIVERWGGDRRVVAAAVGLGVVLIALCGLGLAAHPGRALVGYLFAFDFWVGLSIASLMLLAIWHATGAKWPVVFRRWLEVQASTVWLAPLLFLPVGLGVKWIFPWTDPLHLSNPKLHAKVLHQAPYLNVGFFEVRAGLYFLLWIAVAESLLWLSRRQDETPDPKLTRVQRIIGAVSLPPLAFSLTWAAVDWVMSLDPTWYSSLFGVYFWCGSLLAALGVLSLAVSVTERPPLFGSLTNANHRASLGKFMLGFTAFWAYLAWDQFMLVWIANLPSEIHWYVTRIHPGWAWFSVVLIFLRFVVPFALLLSRRLKESRRGLAFVGGWMLLGHLWDVYWMVLPSWDDAGVRVHWVDVVAWCGVGCLTAGFALWRLGGDRTVPVGDPYLYDSLRYDGQ